MSALRLEKGRLARSKAGRDAGRLCVVVEVLDEDFVLTCDGRLRTLDRPKKKRKKHLEAPCPPCKPLSRRGGRWKITSCASGSAEEEEKLVQV